MTAIIVFPTARNCKSMHITGVVFSDVSQDLIYH